MPLNFSMISVWYGISKSGTAGSPNFPISTFSLSSFPIGTLGSIILGITIIISFTFSWNSFSCVESSSRRAAFLFTSSFLASASSFLPCAIKAPISLEIFFLEALRLSASCCALRALASSSITLSTNGSFSSWNLFFIFCLTISGFSLRNLISNIWSLLFAFYNSGLLTGIFYTY